MKIRAPYVSGRFYPDSKEELDNMIKKLLEKEKSKLKKLPKDLDIIGGIVPHAGYMYSGYEAVHFFHQIRENQTKYDTIVIINPSHTGYGPEIALDENEYWMNTFGKVKIDNEFCEELKFEKSEIAHKYEHSGEVMLPFLQYFLDYTFDIAPISFKMQNYENAKLIASEIDRVQRKLNKKILVIASSDFSHYVSPDLGKQLDEIVVDSIYKFDSKKIYEDILNYNISVCGYGPIMTLIEYSKLKINDAKVDLLRSGNSGDIIPANEVVDYYAFLFYGE